MKSLNRGRGFKLRPGEGYHLARRTGYLYQKTFCGLELDKLDVGEWTAHMKVARCEACLKERKKFGKPGTVSYDVPARPFTGPMPL